MKELKNRIFTSFILILLLYLSIINKIILLISLFLIVFFIFDEFKNIFFKIFKKKKFIIFLLLILIIIYLIFFSLNIWLFLHTEFLRNQILFAFILSICISTDIGGYFFGKIFKGKKLTSISPKKTYSGMFGSFILSTLISFIFYKNLNLYLNYILITFIISFISQLGDLFISFLKRKAKLKNTGSVLPGHGGILDRLDGILFAVPIGLILVSL